MKIAVNNVGQYINTQETKTLVQSRTRMHKKDFEMDDDIEAVGRFKSLAVELNSNGTEVNAEIQNRIIVENKPYFSLLYTYIPLQNHSYLK